MKIERVDKFDRAFQCFAIMQVSRLEPACSVSTQLQTFGWRLLSLESRRSFCFLSWYFAECLVSSLFLISTLFEAIMAR